MLTASLAIRNVFRHKTRSVITLSAIAFGCTAIIFVGGFFEDVFYKMRESYITAHTGHIQSYKRGFSEKGIGKPFDYLIEKPEEVIPLIRRIDQVASVTRRLEFAGLISTGENTVSCIGQGIEPRNEPSVRLRETTDSRADLASMGGTVIESGEPLREEQSDGVLLGRGLAAGLNAHAGTGLILVANTIGGSINALDVTVTGVFFTSSKVFDDHILRLPLASAQQLLQTDAVQSLVVLLKRTEETSNVKQQLEHVFHDRQLNLELKTWEELGDFYQRTRQMFGRMFFILKSVIAIIVVLSIYNTMNMAVVERINEIGTLMALGTTRRGIWRLFLWEGAALGVIGGVVGVTVGTAVTLLVRRIGIPMPPPPGATMTWVSEPIIVPSVLAFALALSVVTSLISAFYPAYQASRLGIAEALRHTS